jgi:hypothetical protein
MELSRHQEQLSSFIIASGITFADLLNDDALEQGMLRPASLLYASDPKSQSRWICSKGFLAMEERTRMDLACNFCSPGPQISSILCIDV